MRDLIEISYTGDILAHRRCPRAWSYEKLARFHPYEQVQAMEGRLIHHAMEWLTKNFREDGTFPKRKELREQLEKYFRVLYARGIKTAFQSKKDTLDRIIGNLYTGHQPHPIVRVAVEGAQHEEYEIKTVRKLVSGNFAGKKRLMLTGVLDLVVQQQSPLTYEQSWHWTDKKTLNGEPRAKPVAAATGEWEIWDYKGTRADSKYLVDYVRQLVTYAALFEERTGELPARCVLFFVNESDKDHQLLVIPVDSALVKRALDWTIQQVALIRQTELKFQAQPLTVDGGSLELHANAIGSRTTTELKAQCTACGVRFDCEEYKTFLKTPNHPDIQRDNIRKN